MLEVETNLWARLTTTLIIVFFLSHTNNLQCVHINSFIHSCCTFLQPLSRLATSYRSVRCLRVRWCAMLRRRLATEEQWLGLAETTPLLSRTTLTQERAALSCPAAVRSSFRVPTEPWLVSDCYCVSTGIVPVYLYCNIYMLQHVPLVCAGLAMNSTP